MTDWEEYKLGELAEVQTGPFGSQLHASDYKERGIPSIMPTNIGNRLEVNLQNIAYISEEDAKRLSRYLLLEGDIVYSRRGDVEKCAYIGPQQSGWLCGTGCIRIRINANKAFPKFCAYLLSTPDSKSRILNSAVGTTMPNLNSRILSEVPLLLPSVDEQRAIASVLSCLDEKIDLLHRQNKTLEAMAETLFRQLFVEEAKDEWGEAKLEEFGNVICGKTPSKKARSFFGGNVPFIKIPDMHGKVFVFDTEDSLTEEGADSQPNKMLPELSICVSCIATVGLVCMNALPSQTNQQINSIVPYEEKWRYYLYCKLKTMEDELLSRASGGTATDNLNTGDFSRIQIPKPPQEIVNRFHERITPLFSKIFSSQIQVRMLSQMRDTLLPKLMSGEVRVAG